MLTANFCRENEELYTHHIFSNVVLQRISKKLPRTKEELQEINGVNKLSTTATGCWKPSKKWSRSITKTRAATTVLSRKEDERPLIFMVKQCKWSLWLKPSFCIKEKSIPPTKIIGCSGNGEPACQRIYINLEC